MITVELRNKGPADSQPILSFSPLSNLKKYSFPVADNLRPSLGCYRPLPFYPEAPTSNVYTPNLDRLAQEGCSGLADPVAPGVVPDTAAGSLALFGQSPLALKRGPVEALGAGIELSPGDIALRANFATLENGLVVDRRAGRIREGAEELAKALDRLPLPGSLADDVELRVRPATEHRVALVLRGEGLSSAILGSDPGDGTPPGPPPIPLYWVR